MTTSASRRRRVGLGVTALIGALIVCVAGILLGAALSAEQPLAPALLGGGLTLTGLFLARWGYRTLSA